MQIGHIAILSHGYIRPRRNPPPRRMTKIVRTFEVAGPPENVFGLLSDPEKWPRWAPFVRQASRIGPKTHWISDLGGMKVEAHTEVTESSENRRNALHQHVGVLATGSARVAL